MSSNILIRRFHRGSRYIKMDINTATYPTSGFRVQGARMIDWGDGIVQSVTATAQNINHTYSEVGIHTVKIYGNILYLNARHTAGYYCDLLSIDTSKAPALQTLGVNNSHLTTLDVSNNPALTSLTCYSNQLTTLDVSNSPALVTLTCYSNQLTSLIFGNHTKITEINAADNSNCVGYLDLSLYPVLKNLYINITLINLVNIPLQHNSLEEANLWDAMTASLDVRNFTALCKLKYNGTQLHIKSISQFVNRTYPPSGSSSGIYERYSLRCGANTSLLLNNTVATRQDLLSLTAGTVESEGLFDYPQSIFQEPVFSANETKDNFSYAKVLLYLSRLQSWHSNNVLLNPRLIHPAVMFSAQNINRPTSENPLSCTVVCKPDAHFFITGAPYYFSVIEQGDKFMFDGSQVNKFETRGDTQYSYIINGDGDYVITISNIRFQIGYAASPIYLYLFENKYPAEANPYTSKVLSFTAI